MFKLILFLQGRNECISTPVFPDFSFSFLRHRLKIWITLNLQTTCTHYWNFAGWSGFSTHVHIVGFFEQSGNFKSNSTILKIQTTTTYKQHLHLHQSVNLLAYLLCFTVLHFNIVFHHCGKLVRMFIVYHKDNLYRLSLILPFCCYI